MEEYLGLCRPSRGLDCPSPAPTPAPPCSPGVTVAEEDTEQAAPTRHPLGPCHLGVRPVSVGQRASRRGGRGSRAKVLTRAAWPPRALIVEDADRETPRVGGGGAARTLPSPPSRRGGTAAGPMWVVTVFSACHPQRRRWSINGPLRGGGRGAGPVQPLGQRPSLVSSQRPARAADLSMALRSLPRPLPRAGPRPSHIGHLCGSQSPGPAKAGGRRRRRLGHRAVFTALPFCSWCSGRTTTQPVGAPIHAAVSMRMQHGAAELRGRICVSLHRSARVPPPPSPHPPLRTS